MRNERGFTLAELLVAIAVVGLLMSALFVTLFQGQSAFLFGSTRAEIQQNARLSLSKMVEELRTGSSVTALTPVGAVPTSITFQFVDYCPGPNPPVTETSVSVTVTYTLPLNSTDLQRNQSAGACPGAPPLPAQPETLVGGVTSLTFRGFDQNNNPTIAPPNVFAVQVSVTTQPERQIANTANQRAVFEDRVKLRNK
jgi:prepilin-type N-terminal cleavage/methylation domain-containing protein